MDTFPQSHQERSEGRYAGKGYLQLLIDEFIQELINYGNDDAWSYVSDESYVIGTIEHSKEGMCYDVNLSYELSKALHLLLLDIYDNDRLNEWFEHRRARFNYNDILKKIKNDRISRKIVIDAWNMHAPCKKK